MPIWSKPKDEHYHGPCTYRLIVNGQNYCGKTFDFHDRMRSHKTKAKRWKERFQRGEHISDVNICISDGWMNVVIIILNKYPDKDKNNPEDRRFMEEREIEAIALYDSFHNGLNMTKGGTGTHWRSASQRKALSKRMKGNKYKLGSTRTEAQKRAMSLRMKGHNYNVDTRKPLTAKQGDKTWRFESALQASKLLFQELGESYNNQAIGRAAKGKYENKSNPHIYKGIHFKYD